MIGSVLSGYGLKEKDCTVSVFGNGLINQTWKVQSHDGEWLLQKINHRVFTRPLEIMENLKLLSDYFRENHPSYLFVGPVDTVEGQNYIKEGDDYYRLFPFVKNSYSCDTVYKPSLAFEASAQFGKFTRLLASFDPARLHVTLPDFHNLTIRHEQFVSAVQNGNSRRISECTESIAYLESQQGIVTIFENIRQDPSFRIRVIHHDAKINNVLFDRSNDRGLCVIDLDTVMDGYFISDVGDMLRTYLSPASEEDPDYSRIEIRTDYFAQIVKGYLGEMNSGLSAVEKQYFVYAGKFAIYMQALRFLTDYLLDDRYYHITHGHQNLSRADNQIVLLKRFLEKEERLKEILETYSANPGPV
jgi:aminoglycoside phosphotransferase (APT) family kinase protein